MPGLWWWSRQRRLDSGIRGFLGGREAWACAFTGRLLVPGYPERIPARGRGGLFALRERIHGGLAGLALFTSTGTFLPAFGERMSGDSLFAEKALSRLRRSPLLAGWKPDACVGPTGQVASAESAFAWNPALKILYDSMDLPPGSCLPPSRSLPAGYCLKRAGPGDLESLLDVAEAYEREEVLTDFHRFDPASSRLSQLRTLERYRVWVVESPDGTVVARAQTNAWGFTREQLGGVFVEPSLRGKGLGRAVVHALCQELLDAGKGVCLFVKKQNKAAIALYSTLGFAGAGDFSVDYFF